MVSDDLASDAGGNPLRRPSLNHLSVNMASNVGGNQFRCSALSHLFVNLVSDVSENPLCGFAMNHQKLARLCCRRTTLTYSSIVESTSLPCLLSMNGEKFSDSFSSFSFSLLTGFLPCGAVCMGSKGAIEITPVFPLVKIVSQRHLTISLLSNFVVSMHSNLVLNLLST